MFSISPSEFIVIALVALVVVGPAKLLELSRKAGELVGKVKAAADDLKVGIETELGDAAAPFREAGSEIKAVGKDLVETAQGELRWVDANKPAATAAGADAAGDTADAKQGPDPDGSGAGKAEELEADETEPDVTAATADDAPDRSEGEAEADGADPAPPAGSP